MKPALVVIDIQNDYFPGGAFPLDDAEGVLGRIEQAIGLARQRDIPVILVQHIARPPAGGTAPFFNPGTSGVELHPRILAAAPDAPIVVKHFADSFHQTTLDETLVALGVEEILLCGMMTQNCVTHTALSRAADRYRVKVLGDCCTTVSLILHRIALNALTTRLEVVDSAQALGAA